jgi:hypothetical protein
MLAAQNMNSDECDSDDYDNNDHIDTPPPEPTCDNLLRALASRYNPGNSFAPVNFKKFADYAETVNGEKPFGVKGSRERRESRSALDVYRNRAARGTDLGVEPTWDVFSVVNRTDELVSILENADSSTLSPTPQRRPTSHSPTRPTHNGTSTRQPKSLSPKRPTKSITPQHQNMSGAKPNVGAGSGYTEKYNRLLEENTTHALSLSTRMANHKCFLYEQKDVEVSAGEYTTKIGLFVQTDGAVIAPFTTPRLRTDGKGVVMWLPLVHHLVSGHLENNSTFLQDKIGSQQGADKARDAALDRMLGTDGVGIKFHDITDSKGNVIKDVPFVEHNFMLPPGIETENRYFNPGKPAHDDHHLDCKLVILSDIKEKDATYEDIIDNLRDSFPTADAVARETDDAAKLDLYKAATMAFINAQQDVNTVTFAAVEFSVYGEDQAGRRAGSKTMDVGSLISAINFLG